MIYDDSTQQTRNLGRLQASLREDPLESRLKGHRVFFLDESVNDQHVKTCLEAISKSGFRPPAMVVYDWVTGKTIQVKPFDVNTANADTIITAIRETGGVVP